MCTLIPWTTCFMSLPMHMLDDHLRVGCTTPSLIDTFAPLCFCTTPHQWSRWSMGPHRWCWGVAPSTWMGQLPVIRGTPQRWGWGMVSVAGPCMYHHEVSSHHPPHRHTCMHLPACHPSMIGLHGRLEDMIGLHLPACLDAGAH